MAIRNPWSANRPFPPAETPMLPADIKPGMYLRQLNEAGPGYRGRLWRVVAVDRRWAFMTAYIEFFSKPHNPEQFDLTRAQFERISRATIVGLMGEEKTEQFDRFCEDRHALFYTGVESDADTTSSSTADQV